MLIFRDSGWLPCGPGSKAKPHYRLQPRAQVRLFAQMRSLVSDEHKAIPFPHVSF